MGENYDDFVGGVGGCVTMAPNGITITGDTIPIEGDEDDRAIAWAVAHAVFGLMFERKFKMLGTTIYNHVCGFATPEPKRVGKVLKGLRV